MQKHWNKRGVKILQSIFLIAVTGMIFPQVPTAMAQAPGEFTVFQKTYERASGAPVTVHDTFSVLNPGTLWTVRAVNGDLEDDAVERVSSSRMEVNGIEILSPNQFNQNVQYIEESVSLSGQNTVDTVVKGKPGGQLIITITGEDAQAPDVAWDMPQAGHVTNAPVIAAQLRAADTVSGLNPDALAIFLNNEPVTGAFTAL